LNSLSKKVKGIELNKESLTIGRAPDNDMQIMDKRLSGKHCTIRRKIDNEGRMIVVLEDSSSNGTYLNSAMVSEIIRS
jgi:pSer/pThr/pTyr-binding forkhead associated (FHA) protein